MAGREDKQRSAGKVRPGIVDLAGKVNSRVQAELAALGFEPGFLGSRSGDEQMDGGERLLHRGQRVEKEIEAFFPGQPANGQQVRARFGPIICSLPKR